MASGPYADMEEAWYDIFITASHQLLMFRLKFGVSSEDISSLFCPPVLLFFGRIPLYFLKEWTRKDKTRSLDFDFGRFCLMSFQLPMIWNKKGIWLSLSVRLGVPPLIVLSQALTFQRFPTGLKESVYTFCPLYDILYVCMSDVRQKVLMTSCGPSSLVDETDIIYFCTAVLLTYSTGQQFESQPQFRQLQLQLSKDYQLIWGQ